MFPSEQCSITGDGEWEMLHFSVAEHNAAHCVQRENEIWMKRGEEVRRQGQTLFGGTASLPALVIDRLVQWLHSHECHHTHFPQKSVYQHCLSRATAMTSNHRRAGTS